MDKLKINIFIILFNYFIGLENDKQASETLKDIDSMKIRASFKDFKDTLEDTSATELLLLTHYSPSQHHLKVWTSTKDAKVLLFICYRLVLY